MAVGFFNCARLRAWIQTNMIDIQDLSLTYAGPQGPVHALKNINLHIQAGEVFGIIGRSGAGKSSLVRCMNLLNRPGSGKMIVNGRDLLQLSDAQLRQARQEIGMVFQHFNLLSSRTVFDNAALPLELAGVSKAQIAQRITPLLELVGLAHLANRYPAQISGGQKQRIGIARALYSDIDYLFFDEATSALDGKTEALIMNAIEKLSESKTIVMIAHRLNTVKNCDIIYMLDHGNVVDSGNFDYLIENNSKFREMAGED